MDEELVSLLFSTHAFKVADSENPFWYTSGKLGPYFINVDYLYGSQKDSEDLLKIIDDLLANSDKEDLPGKLYEILLNHYETNEIFKTTIDKLVEYIENNFQLDLIDYISGGERRDWYFSILVANFLGKPHITIYKDLTSVISNSDFSETKESYNIEGKNVLHIADLITVASSYLRAWIPAIENLGGKILWSCVVVDRMQGGKEKLNENGIKSFSLVKVDTDLFKKAFNMGIINNSQLDMLNNFFKNPDNTMREFLIKHPEFLESSLKSDEKTRKRAKLLIDNNLYKIK